MASASIPSAELSHLPKADGSATFSASGYSTTVSVNGPVEAPRRDENPFEALVDVIVRPVAGVGGTAERALEDLLQQALRQLIPVRDFPRALIQVTLQVLETPENAYENAKTLSPRLNIPLIPPLLHAAILGLLSGSVPLKGIATATTLAVMEEGIVVDPTIVQASKARSVHVLGFTSDNELLLAESEGAFSVDEWSSVLERGQAVCCEEGDGLESGGSVREFVRRTMEGKVAADLAWKV